MFKQSLAKTALVLMAGLLMAGTAAAKEMKIGYTGLIKQTVKLLGFLQKAMKRP